jgi:glycosyltransferase involved in cell wall biosynthesis
VNVLALASRHIRSAQSGYDLRVANLCRQTPGERHLMVVPLSAPDERAATIDASAIFATVRETTPLRGGPFSLSRHLRLSDDCFLRWSQPVAFAAAAEQLRAFVREQRIDRAIVFGGDLAEFAPALRGCEVVLDVCDSRSLTARRALEISTAVGRARWKAQVELFRTRATESRLPRRFGCVTTISEPDRRELLDLHGPADNLHVIPNGVGDRLLDPPGPAGTRRGIAFWGDLAFAPNAEALRYIVDDVFVPFLAARGVELCIVGDHAPRWLAEVAERVPGIVVAGFVPDLAGTVGQYPIMVNPMRTGSGLKNKVLEAFGLGLAVISTRLGVDALTAVRGGEHAVLADTPAELSREILALLEDGPRRERLRSNAHALLRARYPWDRVGREWRSLLGIAESPLSQQR